MATDHSNAPNEDASAGSTSNQKIGDSSKHTQKRTVLQREEDLKLIAELHLAGLSQAEIAARISSIRPYTLSREQVRYDLNNDVKPAWREKNAGNLADLKARELESIKRQEQILMEAWEESKIPIESVRLESTPPEGGGEPQMLRIIKTRTKRHGDPKFLSQIIELRSQRIKILGLDAPAKIEVSESGMSPERHEQLRAAYYHKVRTELLLEQQMASRLQGEQSQP